MRRETNIVQRMRQKYAIPQKEQQRAAEERPAARLQVRLRDTPAVPVVRSSLLTSNLARLDIARGAREDPEQPSPDKLSPREKFSFCQRLLLENAGETHARERALNTTMQLMAEDFPDISSALAASRRTGTEPEAIERVFGAQAAGGWRRGRLRPADATRGQGLAGLSAMRSRPRTQPAPPSPAPPSASLALDHFSLSL